MNMQVSTCPELSELEKLASGRLTAAATETLIQHLEACPTCFAKIPALGSAPDTLVELLAKAKAWAGLEGLDLAKDASCLQPFVWRDGLWNWADGYEPAADPPRYEVVVVDSGSADDTVAIARAAGARVIEYTWEGFGPQKRFAVTQAAYDWVLCIDADEHVSERLRDSIVGELRAPRARAYELARCNRFLGSWLRHGEGYPDWCLRLFDRRAKPRVVHGFR